MASSSSKIIYDDDYGPLSGKPYFDMILTKSYLVPRDDLIIPKIIYPRLPNTTAPAILFSSRKEWSMILKAGKRRRLTNG